jgi:hypothetical protein
LKQTGNEAGFLKLLKRKNIGLPLPVVFVRLKTDPFLNNPDNPSTHYKKELINYLVVINKFELNFENRRYSIEGDLDAQQRVRFALYNLYLIRPETRDRALLPACRLGIQWTYFWDSEL